MRTQQGVALIQVLLITGMLLLLMIQISKDAGKQIDTAILLKEKVILELEMLSAKENLKFELLTANKSESSGVSSSLNLKFYGEEVAISSQVSMELQDEDGLVSLPYGGEELDKLLGGDIALIAQVKKYQGQGDFRSLSGSERGGLMPNKKELKLASLIQSESKLEGSTHLPTFQFNLYHSPLSLIREMHGSEVESVVRELRNNGNTNSESWKDATGQEPFVSQLPGNFITASFHGKGKNLNLVRDSRLMMNFDQRPFMAEVAVK